jgi:gliding motility-associated protein GldM
MAGGGKETPRQRMIGIMYLVLMAMLALQVSNTVLEKFILIDESLQSSIAITNRNNENTIAGIADAVEKNGSRPDDVQVIESARDIKQKTQIVINEIETIRKKIVEFAQPDPETGAYQKASDYDAQMVYMIGPEGSKSGEAYTLEKMLNAYSSQLNDELDTTFFEDLAQSGTNLTEASKGKENLDWAYVQFDHAPNVAVLAILSQIKS